MKYERYKRGYKGLYQATLLNKIRNPSECLPSTRSSLPSYALEYDGALRMIRVS